MKQSRYNYVKAYDDGTMLIYNTLSSGVLKLNQAYSTRYKEVEANGFEGDLELIENLKRGQIIIEDDFDELGFLSLKGKIGKFSANSLNLTIAPTLKCNFKCPYCYEKNVNLDTMSNDTQDKLIEFINAQTENVKSLGIVWYGGEPLLAFDIIESLSKRIIDICAEKNVHYEAHMVTNGYLITDEYANKMKALKITRVQITIDGDADQHNKRRICHDGSPSFEVILNNIEKFHTFFNIHIRINVDKNNSSSFSSLLEELKQRELINKLSIYVAHVDNVNDTYVNSECLSIAQFSDSEIDFYNQLVDTGFAPFKMPTATFGYCGAHSLTNFVIDPNGLLYKCWNEIGHTDQSIGSLTEGVKSSFHNCKWLLHDVFDNKKCVECIMMPICFGGCAHKIFNGNANICTSTKFNIDKKLDLLVKLRQNNSHTDLDTQSSFIEVDSHASA